MFVEVILHRSTRALSFNYNKFIECTLCTTHYPGRLCVNRPCYYLRAFIRALNVKKRKQEPEWERGSSKEYFTNLFQIRLD